MASIPSVSCSSLSSSTRRFGSEDLVSVPDAWLRIQELAQQVRLSPNHDWSAMRDLQQALGQIPSFTSLGEESQHLVVRIQRTIRTADAVLKTDSSDVKKDLSSVLNREGCVSSEQLLSYTRLAVGCLLDQLLVSRSHGCFAIVEASAGGSRGRVRVVSFPGEDANSQMVVPKTPIRAETGTKRRALSLRPANRPFDSERALRVLWKEALRDVNDQTVAFCRSLGADAVRRY